MKKSVAVSLTLIILFNIAAYYVWFTVLQFSIHSEIKQAIIEGLKEKDLIRIEVSENYKTTIRWTEVEKEFCYKCEMYDVVKIKKKKGKSCYYCINDRKEEELFALFKKTHSLKKEIDKKLIPIFHLQYFPQEFASVSLRFITKTDYPNLVFLFASNSPDIISPPPKAV
ncbi:MAG: hypothetical protein WCO13_12435 [Bacteroidota bacterium]